MISARRRARARLYEGWDTRSCYALKLNTSASRPSAGSGDLAHLGRGLVTLRLALGETGDDLAILSTTHPTA